MDKLIRDEQAGLSAPQPAPAIAAE
jgi:hypothetical protein